MFLYCVNLGSVSLDLTVRHFVVVIQLVLREGRECAHADSAMIPRFLRSICQDLILHDTDSSYFTAVIFHNSFW